MKRALIIAPFLLIACHGEVAELGEEFSIKGGQTMMVEEEQLTIKLKSVENDSRCPVKQRCVWQGNAQVKLLLHKTGKSPSTLSLNTAGMRKYPREAKYLNYTIKLTQLTPQPTSNRPIPQTNYIATLMISR